MLISENKSFAVFNVGGLPDNNGDQDFHFLLDKGMLWIGTGNIKKDTSNLSSKIIENIFEQRDYYISYKSKKIYGDNFGWYDIYQKKSDIHKIDSVEKWKLITDNGNKSNGTYTQQELSDYFSKGNIDYLIYVDKVYEGKITEKGLPHMRRLQSITNKTVVDNLEKLL